MLSDKIKALEEELKPVYKMADCHEKRQKLLDIHMNHDFDLSACRLGFDDCKELIDLGDKVSQLLDFCPDSYYGQIIKKAIYEGFMCFEKDNFERVRSGEE